MMYQIREGQLDRIKEGYRPAWKACFEEYLGAFCHTPGMRLQFGDCALIAAARYLADNKVCRSGNGRVFNDDSPLFKGVGGNVECFRHSTKPTVFKAYTDDMTTNRYVRDIAAMISTHLKEEYHLNKGPNALPPFEITGLASTMAQVSTMRQYANGKGGVQDVSHTRNFSRARRVLYHKDTWKHLMPFAVKLHRGIVAQTWMKEQFFSEANNADVEKPADFEGNKKEYLNKMFFNYAHDRALREAENHQVQKHGTHFAAPVTEHLRNAYEPWMVYLPQQTHRNTDWSDLDDDANHKRPF